MFMLKNLIDYLNKAKNENFAIGQFNFSTIDQLQGIAKASLEMSAPVICGTSTGEAQFFGMYEAVAMVKALREERGVPIFINLDHGKDIDLIKKAVDIGYDAVHFDGSELDIEDNISLAKEVVDYAKNKDVVVEGEVGKIGGSSSVHEDKLEQSTLTSMDKIVRFIKETGVDTLALDAGTVHGVYSNSPEIDFNRIEEASIKTNSFIVLHGGSGVEDEDIKEAVKKGVVKININTELRAVWRDALYKEMSDNPKQIVPYKILCASRDAVSKKTKQKIILFGSDLRQ